MIHDYGFVDGLFDTVATDSDLTVHLSAETLYDGAVAVAVNPENPSLALITPIVGMDASDDAHELERVNYVLDQDDRKIAAVYREGDELSPGLVNDLVRLADRPVTHSIYVKAGLLSDALSAFESDQTVELCLVPSDAPPMSRVPSPWEALVIALAGGYPGNVAVIAPFATLTNTGRHGTDAPRTETSPIRPTHPGSPWLNASIPDEDPDDGDKCWLAIRGRKNWTVIAARWDEGRSEWLTLDGRQIFGFVNHRDLECYHCPLAEFPGQVEAFDFLN